MPGITVWNIGNTSVHNMPEVTLNLPGRDKKTEEYQQYLRNLGAAGIHRRDGFCWPFKVRAAALVRFRPVDLNPAQDAIWVDEQTPLERHLSHVRK